MERFVCIHGHFYQPPRENPWLEEVELQESAYPYHDWNERITAECYAPNTASRIIDPKGTIVNIINNYSKISFNFGPTLLYWLEKHEPEVYEAILEADKVSMERFSGHGSAIAQPYNHIIMPLANKRDKYTQVKWGIEDFKKRFKRYPEGIWLPETAVDLETLDILAEFGIKFTILSPHQAERVRRFGDREWFDVRGGIIDPKKVYLCNLPSGRSINIFFYDRLISSEVAFGNLLDNGELFARRLIGAFTDESYPQLVHIATDGETYGHHHKFGDMALAYCLHYIESNNLARITNYGEYLERFPPQNEVQIIENTSWSCVHGVERWRDNCGCSAGRVRGWSQEWRKPLRIAMDWLRNRLAKIFEYEALEYLKDPWRARDDYITIILDRSKQNVEDFLAKHAKRELVDDEKRNILRLLEMQRNALLMYTSCGWFFDDISDIETVQVMQYAARAMQLAHRVSGIDLKPDYINILKEAPSNNPKFKNGADVFNVCVVPLIVDLVKVGVHYVISSLFAEVRPSTIYCYKVSDEIYEEYRLGRLKLIIGRSKISSNITWSSTTISYSALWFGDHNVFGGVKERMSDEEFMNMRKEILSKFERAEVQKIVTLIDKYFEKNTYSIKDLFKDEQRKILQKIMQVSVGEIESYYRRIFKDNYPIMRFLRDVNIAPPKALQVAANVAINSEISEIISSKDIDLDLLEKLVDYTRELTIEIDRELIGLKASSRIAAELKGVIDDPENIENLEKVEKLLELLNRLPIQLNLWRSQNIIFSLCKSYYQLMKERGEKGDRDAIRWLTTFNKLCELLKVKI
ncbi:MAG: DUF3536 domain-containing protein [Nitrososphaerales archaeon]|nr:DUF3536 domain-containing protein [Nitrososphaerales archaeon]